MQRRQAERVASSERLLEPVERSSRLGDMNDALGERERRAERVLGPGEHWVPLFPLRVRQVTRSLRPVAEEVRTGEGENVVDDRLLTPRHAVDGELGERHGRWIDALPLRAPLPGNSLGQR